MFCRDCRHWEKEESGQDGGEWGEEMAAFRGRFGKCQLITRRPLWEDTNEWERDEKGGVTVLRPLAEVLNDKAFLQDGSGYMAEFYTKDDFGCVEFASQE